MDLASVDMNLVQPRQPILERSVQLSSIPQAMQTTQLTYLALVHILSLKESLYTNTKHVRTVNAAAYTQKTNKSHSASAPSLLHSFAH
jgi:hypothetical protein